MEQKERKEAKEEYAVILDFLQYGYPEDTRPSYKKTPIAQAIGKDHFSLLELVPKPGVFLKVREEVYIGEGKRDKIHHIVGKITSDKLTSTAMAELQSYLEEAVTNNEKRFVEFFNVAQPLTTRMHSLELLPGLGKKHMWEILEARKEKPFESFEDLKKRIGLIPDPKKMIVRRILQELTGKEKHLIFVR